MTPEQITKALEAGIITQAQADKMRPKDRAAVIGNEDDMRFLRSFSDVFIAIGVGLLALGLATIAGIFGGGISFIGAAIVMGFLAEYFGRKRRAHAPTLVTALAFLLFVQSGAEKLIGFGGGVAAALVTLGAMLLFYWRVRLPFCIALIAIAVLYLFFALFPNMVQAPFGLSLFIGGILIFAVALAYDVRDTHRTTRFADNAFWLHFLAAPLIIHGLALSMVNLQKDTLFNIVPVVSLGRGDALLVMLMVFVLTLIGLAINRRALIVSSLGYAGFAIGFLFDKSGVGLGTTLALTLLVLGAAVIFLGAGWHSARGLLLKFLPNWKIFPPAFDPNYKP